ncbi:MAG TPA: EamA family transporter [Microbacterium sp.]|uniref:EamA family transporter n=1 Tax=Microbacterium sp. TaxID=51671 RepID=UPI002B46DF73|nr:EamA family transporter [Microbacterium sp.]HKT57706.1 EamA family transporter [Microbacterium sp.]
MSVLLALTAAITYGVGDFLGGLSARRWRVFPTTLTTCVVATVLLGFVLLITGGEWSAATLLSGSLAGLFAASGFLTFYAALAVGPISIIAPLIALLNSAVPVLWSVLFGAQLSPLAWTAITIAVIGSVLAGSQHGGTARGVRGKTLLYTVISGLSFGLCIVALDGPPASSQLIPAFLDSAVSALLLVLLIGLAAVSPTIARWLSGLDAPADVVGTPHGPDIDVSSSSIRTLERKPSVGLRLGVASGTFTAAANAAVMTALHTGDLAVVAVLNNLYPVSTIVLAWIVLRERLSLVQLAGVVLAVVASVLLGIA